MSVSREGGPCVFPRAFVCRTTFDRGVYPVYNRAAHLIKSTWRVIQKRLFSAQEAIAAASDKLPARPVAPRDELMTLRPRVLASMAIYRRPCRHGPERRQRRRLEICSSAVSKDSISAAPRRMSVQMRLRASPRQPALAPYSPPPYFVLAFLRDGPIITRPRSAAKESSMLWTLE